LAWALSLSLGLTFPFICDIQCDWLNWTSHWVAENSYGIYLSHSFVMWYAVKVMVHRSLPLRVLVLVAGSIWIPMFLYRYIEKPMIGVGARIASRKVVRPAIAFHPDSLAFRFIPKSILNQVRHRKHLHDLAVLSEPEEAEARNAFHSGQTALDIGATVR